MRHLLALLILLTLPLAFAQQREMRLFIWSEYMDPAIIKAFEQRFNVRVRIDLYESNEDMLAKLQAGGVSQYDVIVPGDYIIPTLIQLRLIQPLDKSKIPNIRNLEPQFANPPFDPGNRFSVAYQWGMSGLMYRKDRVPTPTSWSVILGPGANQPFVMMDSIREMMGAALRFQGRSINSRNAAEVRAAGQVLLNAKRNPRFLGFEGGVGAKNRLVAGTATYAVVYNGDALRAAAENPNVGFVVPREGAALFLDNLAIPARAPNPEAAHQFINFILDARIGAQLSNFNRYATPNRASLPFITPADRRNPAIYPDAATMKKLEFVLDLGRDTRLYDEVWTAVKAR
ncbi:spermidine/putrescine ABC transporter substrate-binding protein [uncultured Meiothermus sp.]|jgi:spermidine/putrescine transport system substrate-binding protein|uniref:polyamine ABC transporter substrate-binding protein n=1 Tax=uncultured Meiothermus sp. TaxID=157471 RepID=UPI00262879C3|nr:spermidine/putrescine ABC transporter substrate-binding protein [uncultured Meiothermus sp.]